MSSVIILALAFVVTFLLLSGGFKAMNRLTPRKRKLQNEIPKLREEIRAYLGELVPWNKEEIELLSLTETNKSVKKGRIRTIKGVFNSIFHEPMLAYVLRIYSPRQMILYARTSRHEFVYRMKPEGIEVFADNAPLGKIAADNILIGRNSKNIASTGQESRSQSIPLLIRGQEVARLVNPQLTNTYNPRAFEMISDQLSESDIPLLQALTILELVKLQNDLPHERIHVKARKK